MGLKLVELDEALAKRVPELFYRCYGFTYLGEWAYQPEAMLHQCEVNGARILLGVDEVGNVRVFLRFLPVGYKRAELGPLLVDPSVSAPVAGSCLSRMAGVVREHCIAQWRRDGLLGVQAHVVTTHTLSLRMVSRLGFVPCAVKLGWIPAWADRESVQRTARVTTPSPAGTAEHSLHRRTEVLHFFAFHWVYPKRQVCLPKHYASLLRRLYARMKIQPEEITPVPARGESRIELAIEHQRSAAIINVLQIGEDAVFQIRNKLLRARAGRVDVIFVMLPLGAWSLDAVVDSLRGEGMQLAGLHPLYTEQDALVLQLPNEVPCPAPTLVGDELGSELLNEVQVVNHLQHERPNWLGGLRL